MHNDQLFLINTSTQCFSPPIELQIKNALSLTTSSQKSFSWAAHVSNV